MFDKKQKRCVKCIHFVTGNGLCDQKDFYTVKNFFFHLLPEMSSIYFDSKN